MPKAVFICPRKGTTSGTATTVATAWCKKRGWSYHHFTGEDAKGQSPAQGPLAANWGSQVCTQSDPSVCFASQNKGGLIGGRGGGFNTLLFNLALKLRKKLGFSPHTLWTSLLIVPRSPAPTEPPCLSLSDMS